MYDLIQDIQDKTNQLDISIKTLRKTGSEYAQAYADYRMALAEELLRLKDTGMAVTLAYDVARGKPEIARLKCDEICKEAIYRANLEAINSIKLQIKIMDNQIQREWGQSQ